jgi:hypothetical protein
MGTAAGTLNSTMDCCLLSLRSGRIWLLHHGAITSAIVPLKFLFSLRRDGLIRLKLRIDSRLRAGFSCWATSPFWHQTDLSVDDTDVCFEGHAGLQNSITSDTREATQKCMLSRL